MPTWSNSAYEAKAKELQASIKSKRAEAQAIVALADSEKRELTADEAKSIDLILDDDIRGLQDTLCRYEKLDAFYIDRRHDDEEGGVSAASRPNDALEFFEGGNMSPKCEIIKGNDGQEHGRLYASGTKVSRKPGPQNAFGRFAMSALDGKWARCDDFRNELSTTSDIGGGMTVPEELASEFIDLARAKSVLFRAGAATLVQQSDRLLLTTVSEDPTFTTVGENEVIPESTPKFAGIGMTLRKRGVLVPVSRELLEDSPNFAQQLTELLSRAVALDMDKFILTGQEDSAKYGLLSTDRISETDSIGAISWEDFSTAAINLRSSNEEPNAYIVSPTIAGDLDELLTGDGTNAAKGWLPAPPTLDGVTRYQTSNMPNANALIGDFTQLVIGMKGSGFRLERSSEAGDYFAKDQVVFKLVYRISYGLKRPAFRRLAGITT